MSDIQLCNDTLPDRQLRQRLELNQVHSEFLKNRLRQGVYEET